MWSSKSILLHLAVLEKNEGLVPELDNQTSDTSTGFRHIYKNSFGESPSPSESPFLRILQGGRLTESVRTRVREP